MVCAGESLSPGQGRNNNGLEIGCVVDAASGLLTFTANGKELSTYYQVCGQGWPFASREETFILVREENTFCNTKK